MVVVWKTCLDLDQSQLKTVKKAPWKPPMATEWKELLYLFFLNEDLFCEHIITRIYFCHMSKISRGLRHESWVNGQEGTLHTPPSPKSSSDRRGINSPGAALRPPNTARGSGKKHTMKYKRHKILLIPIIEALKVAPVKDKKNYSAF